MNVPGLAAVSENLPCACSNNISVMNEYTQCLWNNGLKWSISYLLKALVCVNRSECGGQLACARLALLAHSQGRVLLRHILTLLKFFTGLLHLRLRVHDGISHDGLISNAKAS